MLMRDECLYKYKLHVNMYYIHIQEANCRHESIQTHELNQLQWQRHAGIKFPKYMDQLELSTTTCYSAMAITVCTLYTMNSVSI